MKQGLILLPYLFILTFLSSCSDNTPNLEEVKRALSNEIILSSKGDLSLSEFTKTNSFENELFGQRTYTIKYSAKIKVEKDCYLFVDPTGMGPYYFDGFSTFYDPSSKMTPSPLIKILTCKKGDLLNYNGQSTFLWTENGWSQ